ncbi:MAG: GNAT family N-acetyltransferase [Pseudomonadota bacterium]
MFARTERLLLRPGWPEDWQALFNAINDEGIVCNLARAPWPYTPEVAKEFAAKPQDPFYPNFFLTLPTESGSQLVGCCGLGETDQGEAEIGYWIARAHWGQGYATEAAGAVIEIARTIGHRQLHCGHFIDNPASQRVIEKLGFVQQGPAVLRYSAGRGKDVPCMEYVMELEPLLQVA